MLRVRITSCGYGDRAVLEDIAFEVPRGRTLCIIGESGSGKTTLLRHIAGLDRSPGSVLTMDDRPLDRSDGRVAFLPQHHGLLAWMNCVENVALADRIRGVGRREREERAQGMLRKVGLSDAALRMPGELSGGEAQRVALARSLAARPAIMLLDEPFSALDALTRERLQDLFTEVCEISASEATARILVTHGVDEAAYLGDRIAVLAGEPAGLFDISDKIPARATDRTDDGFFRRALEVRRRFEEISA